MDGPVGRYIYRRARWLEGRAVLTAGFDTGDLVSAIDSVFSVERGNIVATVGVNPQGRGVGYALWHHEGTKPHTIAARNAEFLRFPNRRGGGGVVYRQSVRHPGTKPNHYLTKHLREVVT